MPLPNLRLLRKAVGQLLPLQEPLVIGPIFPSHCIHSQAHNIFGTLTLAQESVWIFWGGLLKRNLDRDEEHGIPQTIEL